jgi:catechol 2,3-dioxygenase-like lactoylglutathione lyase family enzyme
MNDMTAPRLHGVHHTAFPTWKPKETIEFYRDILGLRPIHAITAKGWGKHDQPDFLHFFFDAGNNSTIAFFYYVGFDQPADYDIFGPRRFLSTSRHTAWEVASEAELHGWVERLRGRGVKVKKIITHEVIESIYFRDPNGYRLEFTRRLRPLTEVDYVDADLTLRALADTFGDGPRGKTIEDMWRRKAELVRAAAE